MGTWLVWRKPRGGHSHRQQLAMDGVPALSNCLKSATAHPLFPVWGDAISVGRDWLEPCHVAVMDIDLVFPISGRRYTATLVQPLPSGHLSPVTFAVWISTKRSLEEKTAGEIRSV